MQKRERTALIALCAVSFTCPHINLRTIPLFCTHKSLWASLFLNLLLCVQKAHRLASLCVNTLCPSLDPSAGVTPSFTHSPLCLPAPCLLCASTCGYVQFAVGVIAPQADNVARCKSLLGLPWMCAAVKQCWFYSSTISKKVQR